MAAIIYGRMMFNCRNFGISEDYAMLNATMPGALSDLESLATSRLDLMCSDVTLFGMSVSDANVRGDSLISELAGGKGTWGTTAPIIATYQGEEGALVRCTSADYVHRSLRILRLIPSDQFDSGGGLVMIPSFKTAFDDYLALMKTSTMIPAHIANNAPVPPYFTAVAYIKFERQSRRKVGRPFGLEAGRRLTA